MELVYNDTASAPATPAYAKHTFTGWYTGSTLTTLYDFSTPMTGNITLYAGWE